MRCCHLCVQKDNNINYWITIWWFYIFFLIVVEVFQPGFQFLGVVVHRANTSLPRTNQVSCHIQYYIHLIHLPQTTLHYLISWSPHPPDTQCSPGTPHTVGQEMSRRPWSTIHSISKVQYSTVQYSTVQYSTVQHSSAQHSTAQYSTAQYSITGSSRALELSCSKLIKLRHERVDRVDTI